MRFDGHRWPKSHGALTAALCIQKQFPLITPWHPEGCRFKLVIPRCAPRRMTPRATSEYTNLHHDRFHGQSDNVTADIFLSRNDEIIPIISQRRHHTWGDLGESEEEVSLTHSPCRTRLDPCPHLPQGSRANVEPQHHATLHHREGRKATADSQNMPTRGSHHAAKRKRIERPDHGPHHQGHTSEQTSLFTHITA